MAKKKRPQRIKVERLCYCGFCVAIRESNSATVRAAVSRLEEIAFLLLKKNKAYGDSAGNPMRVFAKGLTAEDMINVRMDDKLSRLARGADTDAVPEDTEADLIGYLALKYGVRRNGR